MPRILKWPVCQWTVLGSLAVSLSANPFALGQGQPGDHQAPISRQEYERVLGEIDELRREVESLRRGERNDSGDHQTSARQQPGHKGGLYDKPFLHDVESRVQLGGYFDVEYRDPESQKHEFRFHRLIPFIYADIHERLRFATEIEIEDGSEIGVEFAYLDFVVRNEASFRGGVILDPVGKFNLIHDSPINDLTDRPLVNQFVIPTTLREVGVGLFGTTTPGDSVWEISYEAYLTSGFKGLDNGGNTTINTDDGLRDARPHEDSLGTRHFDDINNKFAGVGRVSVSPFLGSEFGVSAHSGDYDEAGDNNLTIGAVDALLTIPQFEVVEVPIGPVEILAEGAYAWIERDSFAKASGVADDMWGYYVQANYHFMFTWLVDNLPSLFFADSTFTLVTRWGQVDLDGNKQRRLTVGLNFRPIESTAVKFDYQFNQGKGKAAASADDNAVLVSLTSYF